jgi:hypothetical protein
MSLTLEQLTAAIRRARTLEELQRLVGPSPDERRRAEERVAEVFAILSRHQGDPDGWPAAVRERYERLEREQRAYESAFC